MTCSLQYAHTQFLAYFSSGEQRREVEKSVVLLPQILNGYLQQEGETGYSPEIRVVLKLVLPIMYQYLLPMAYREDSDLQ